MDRRTVVLIILLSASFLAMPCTMLHVSAYEGDALYIKPAIGG
jgi:hypothetical protein